MIIPVMLSIAKSMTLARRLKNINYSTQPIIDKKARERNMIIITESYTKENYEK
tara:strand:+ start:275 stop:436 length:162 start_codon:yes stop_codon:yes gene_type:complete